MTIFRIFWYDINSILSDLSISLSLLCRNGIVKKADTFEKYLFN